MCAAQINFSDVSDYHKIKCQAGYMRFHRLAKAIEAAGGVPNGGGDKVEDIECASFSEES